MAQPSKGRSSLAGSAGSTEELEAKLPLILYRARCSHDASQVKRYMNGVDVSYHAVRDPAVDGPAPDAELRAAPGTDAGPAPLPLLEPGPDLPPGSHVFWVSISLRRLGIGGESAAALGLEEDLPWVCFRMVLDRRYEGALHEAKDHEEDEEEGGSSGSRSSHSGAASGAGAGAATAAGAGSGSGGLRIVSKEHFYQSEVPHMGPEPPKIQRSDGRDVDEMDAADATATGAGDGSGAGRDVFARCVPFGLTGLLYDRLSRWFFGGKLRGYMQGAALRESGFGGTAGGDEEAQHDTPNWIDLAFTVQQPEVEEEKPPPPVAAAAAAASPARDIDYDVVSYLGSSDANMPGGVFSDTMWPVRLHSQHGDVVHLQLALQKQLESKAARVGFSYASIERDHAIMMAGAFAEETETDPGGTAGAGLAVATDRMSASASAVPAKAEPTPDAGETGDELIGLDEAQGLKTRQLSEQYGKSKLSLVNARQILALHGWSVEAAQTTLSNDLTVRDLAAAGELPSELSSWSSSSGGTSGSSKPGAAASGYSLHPLADQSPKVQRLCRTYAIPPSDALFALENAGTEEAASAFLSNKSLASASGIRFGEGPVGPGDWIPADDIAGAPAGGAAPAASSGTGTWGAAHGGSGSSATAFSRGSCARSLGGIVIPECKTMGQKKEFLQLRFGLSEDDALEVVSCAGYDIHVAVKLLGDKDAMETMGVTVPDSMRIKSPEELAQVDAGEKVLERLTPFEHDALEWLWVRCTQKIPAAVITRWAFIAAYSQLGGERLYELISNDQVINILDASTAAQSSAAASAAGGAGSKEEGVPTADKANAAKLAAVLAEYYTEPFLTTWNPLASVSLFSLRLLRNANRCCLSCGVLLRVNGMRPTMCGRSQCAHRHASLWLGNALHSFVMRHPRVMDLLISFFYTFVHSCPRVRMPLRWPHGLSNRGRMGVTAATEVTIGPEPNDADLEKLKKAIAACPSVDSMQRTGRRGGTDALEARLDRINTLIVPILRSLLAETPSFIHCMNDGRAPNPLKGTNEHWCFVFRQGNADREAIFQNDRPSRPSFWAWHGSSFFNWWGILKGGLRNFSGTKLMSAGAALGAGIYFSENWSTSTGYSQPGTTWPKTALKHSPAKFQELRQAVTKRARELKAAASGPLGPTDLDRIEQQAEDEVIPSGGADVPVFAAAMCELLSKKDGDGKGCYQKGGNAGYGHGGHVHVLQKEDWCMTRFLIAGASSTRGSLTLDPKTDKELLGRVTSGMVTRVHKTID